MHRIALAWALAACTPGMRPALDRVGKDVAAYTKKSVLYLGDGCYVSDSTVIACSIDSLPAGQLSCAVEPAESGQVVEMANTRWRRGELEYFYDSNLDSFVDRLNTHRCHARWYDSFQASPVAITMRDIRKPSSRRFVPLTELGLTGVPARMAVRDETAHDACRDRVTVETFLAPICVAPDGGVKVPMDYLYTNTSDLPTNIPCVFGECRLRQDFAPAFASVRGAPAEHQRCALVEVTTSPLECRSQSATPIAAE